MDREANGERPGRWVHALAALCLVFLIGVNASVIFSEGWAFDGFPHGYLFTALQVHQGRDVYSADEDAYWGPLLDNWDFSPLYRIGSLLATIGGPTPPWFRLTGCVMLALVFLAAFLFFPHAPPLDRLVTALCVCTAPVMMFAGRYLDDHALHILVLLVAASALVRSDYGRRLRAAWPFYVLPALDLLFTHMVTNHVLTGVCLLYLLGYAVIRRIREDGAGRTLLAEVPRWIACGLLVAAVFALRFTAEDLGALADYYRGQSAVASGEGSWLAGLVAYPKLIVFGEAGLAVSLVALLNLVPRLRGERAGLLGAWLVVPLILLSLLPKKNADYVWYLVPAVCLLAAGVLRRAPAWAKWIAVVVFCAFGSLHAIDRASPLVSLVDLEAFQSAELKKHSRLVADKAQTLSDAREVLALASACDAGDRRALMLFSIPPAQSVQVPIHFAAALLDPRFAFWSFNSGRVDFPPGVVAVELRDFDREGAALTPWEKETYDALTASLAAVRETDRFRVFCRADGSRGVD